MPKRDCGYAQVLSEHAQFALTTFSPSRLKMHRLYFVIPRFPLGMCSTHVFNILGLKLVQAKYESSVETVLMCSLV